MRDRPANKQLLVPLRVPWMISPSVSFLHLVAFESGTQGDTFVEFIAYYHCDDVGPEPTSVRKVTPPPTFDASAPNEPGPYRLARVVFQRAVCARMLLAHADGQVINEALYDWSCVTPRWVPGSDILQFLEDKRALWQRTGICPDPRVYQVQESGWIAQLEFELRHVPSIRANFRARHGSEKGGNPYKHYLMLGHDSYVEVIAKDYNIVEGQVLPGW